MYLPNTVTDDSPIIFLSSQIADKSFYIPYTNLLQLRKNLPCTRMNLQ